MHFSLAHDPEPEILSKPNTKMRYTPEEICMFLEPPSPPETPL